MFFGMMSVLQQSRLQPC